MDSALIEIKKAHTEDSFEQEPEVRLGVWSIFLPILALVSSGLELEVLILLDGMTRFMTLREILQDASVALIPVFVVVAAWWICLIVSVKVVSVSRWGSRHRKAIFWRLGITVPLIYFILELFNSARLQFYPGWHPGLSGWLWILPPLMMLCAITIGLTRLDSLLHFCRTTLAPLGWVHIALLAVTLIALKARGIYIFHDFTNPGRSVATSTLPDVYLITFDTLRAQDMSLYGYRRETTPNLERFSRQSYTFDNFFANSNFTTPSTTSIETGKLPWTHRVFQLGGFLRGQARQQTLAALLKERGYYSASISSNPYASPVQHRTIQSYDAVEMPLPENSERFWDRYTDLVGLNTLHTMIMLKTLAVTRSYISALLWNDHCPSPPEPVFDQARKLIERRDISQPRFIWAHILPPHDPYFPPLPFRGKFLTSGKLSHSYDFLGFRNETPPRGVSIPELRARYDENIAYADHAVGDFLDWLEETGRLDHSIIIVSADHGESFEHGWLSHTGPYLYNSLIRIPLMIHLPGQHQGSRIDQVAQQIDILPTILDSLGQPAPSWAEGESLIPSLKGNRISRDEVFSMNLEPGSTFRQVKSGTFAVITDKFKYILQYDTGKASLFQYKNDPDEMENLVDSNPVVAAQMRAVLDEKLNDVNQTTPAAP